jgi:tetratricopeptide (TPR) repeat protein
MTALLLLAQLCALDSQYLSAVNVADLRYAARDYPAALEYYTRARDLLPGDPGPGTVIGWILYKMGRFVEAESVFDEVLATYPEHERALEGRALVPRPYRLGLTGAVTGDFGTRLTWFGFVEYNRRFVTTITFGFQGVKRDSGWSGFNTGLVVYHRLRYPWSARLDLYTLSALTDPRYWRMVYAPSVTRLVLGMPARLTLIGWDKLGTVGLEAWTERDVGAHFLVSGAPVFNADSGRAGWFVHGLRAAQPPALTPPAQP